MSEITNPTTQEESLDEKKLRKMLAKIYKIERDNSKTNNSTDSKIKEDIKQIIEEEVKKCY